MVIKTLEQLKERIGKFVIFSHNDPNCNDTYATMKLLTRIENGWLRSPHFREPYKHPKSEFYGYEIWGKFSGSPKRPFRPYNTDGKEMWSDSYLYARDPTEEEIKQFKEMWRNYKYMNKKPNYIDL